MSKYRSPNEEQWRHFLLRESGLPFDPEQVEEWQRIFHYNLTLGANDYIDEDDPVDEEVIARQRLATPEEYDVTASRYFAVSLPRDAENVEDKSELYKHLADVIEDNHITSAAAITLEQTLDYDRDGYYPYVVVWRYENK